MNGYNISNYKDLFIDIDKFDEENISYVKPILFYQVTKNMGVYYEKIVEPKKLKSSKSETKSKSKSKKDYRSKKTTLSETIPVKPKRKQKIIVQTPKMVVPFGVKEFDNNGRKSYNMCLSFSSLTNLYNDDDIKKFYYFIKKIDTINQETISEYIKPWKLPKNLKYKKTLQRLSDDFPHYMSINMPHDEKLGFLFNTYDESGKKSTIDIIEKRSIVSAVIELTDIKFTDKIFKSNWTVMQIRKFKPYSPIQEFFMTECFICDEDDPEDTVYANLIEKYHKTLQTPLIVPCPPQMYYPTNISQINPYQVNPYQTYSTNSNIPNSPNYNIPPPPGPIPQKNNTQTEGANFKPPSLQELLSAKKLLKPTTTVIKEVSQGKVIEEGQDMSLPIPPPPPPLLENNKSSEKSSNKSPEKSSNKSPNKSPDKSSKKNLNKSLDESSNKNINKPESKSSEKTSKKTINKSSNKSINKSSNKPKPKNISKYSDSDDDSDENNIAETNIVKRKQTNSKNKITKNALKNTQKNTQKNTSRQE
ncbi:hypothetical protein CE11_00677 [Megavirus courdo11]|uniref:Uncharacterized protein n=1 Tax=Megavirus courdo11 TaxID=1128140 RepID=K7YWI1_9VIRU|nr:hypothetical protein CE11_00677 [Megavirus courdo11]AVL93940.1 hypothetical protein mvi_580 [Megavirus vitis]